MASLRSWSCNAWRCLEGIGERNLGADAHPATVISPTLISVGIKTSLDVCFALLKRIPEECLGQIMVVSNKRPKAFIASEVMSRPVDLHKRLV